MSHGVDVLTLTASPIPRTLEMALTGIRDLSMVNTPPADRQPILTYVGEEDEPAVSEAHPARAAPRGPGLLPPQPGGRHRRGRPAACRGSCPRPGSRSRTARWTRAPSSRWSSTSGTSSTTCSCARPSSSRASTCRRSTRSWSTGPTCSASASSTRSAGRVGRAGQRAYAYLFHPAERVLTEAAYERLRTIGEHTELGSGFKIAMRDLQIRGAGNLLGRDQSGHIAAVGYDLYVQMVAEAVAEAKGSPRARAGHRLDRRPRRRPPAGRLRGGRGRPPRGLPPDRRGPPDRGRRRRGQRVGRPLRPAAARRRGAARAGPPAGDLPAHRGDRGHRRAAPGWPAARSPGSPGCKLPASAQARLHRLARDASYREALDQLVVPLGRRRTPRPPSCATCSTGSSRRPTEPAGPAGNMPGA